MMSLFKIAIFVTMALSQVVLASQACESRIVTSTAKVSVSDGTEYSVETYYRSADESVVTFAGPEGNDIVSEGPFGWYRQGKKTGLAGDREKRFAIGHQYHAMLLYFDDIMSDVRDEVIEFQGESHRARSGNYPYGGTVSLIHGEQMNRPIGILMLLPEETPIEVRLFDWRGRDERQFLPFGLDIHHGDQVFNYEYSSVEAAQGDAIDFHDRFASPAIDEVDIYRLHRAMLAAHCRGDAELMADLSMPQTLIAGGGELIQPSSDEIREQFRGLFEILDYTAYQDLVPPVIEAGESVAWMGVQVRAVAVDRASGQELDSQWAWIMLAKKTDGVWRHSGNASNRLMKN